MHITKVRKLTEQAEAAKAKDKRGENEAKWQRARVEAESLFQGVIVTVQKQIEKAAREGHRSVSIWSKTECDEYTVRVNYLVAKKLSERLKAKGYTVKISVDKNFKYSDDSREEPMTVVVVSW